MGTVEGIYFEDLEKLDDLKEGRSHENKRITIFMTCLNCPHRSRMIPESFPLSFPGRILPDQERQTIPIFNSLTVAIS